MSRYLDSIGFPYYQVLLVGSEAIISSGKRSMCFQDEGVRVRVPYNGSLVPVTSSMPVSRTTQRYLRKLSRQADPGVSETLPLPRPTKKDVTYGIPPTGNVEPQCLEALDYYTQFARERGLKVFCVCDYRTTRKEFVDSQGTEIRQAWFSTTTRETLISPVTGLSLQDHQSTLCGNSLLADRQLDRYRALAEQLLDLPPLVQPPKVIRGQVLLDHQASSSLLHELIGHPMEGDNFIASDTPRRSKRLLCPGLTVVDSPQANHASPTYHEFDDQGFPSRTRKLFDNGWIGETIDTAETSVLTKGKPGGCRTPDWRDPPLPRMTRLKVSPNGLGEGEIETPKGMRFIGCRNGATEVETGISRIDGQFCLARTPTGRQVVYPIPILRMATIEDGISSIACVSRDTELVQSWCVKSGSTVTTESEAPEIMLRTAKIVFGG
jgi:predicted Zn-dependent protease